MGRIMSWRIFVHSVRQVFGNLEGALRVSAVLTIVQIALTLTMGQALLMDQAQLQQGLQDGSIALGPYLATLAALVLIGLWIAVGWHRYVLTNEKPAFVPKLYLDRVLAYFGKSILIGLLVVPIALVLFFLVALAFGPMLLGPAQSQSLLVAAVFLLLVYLPVGTVAMRLSAALPGVAMGPGVSVFAGWRATAGQTWTVMGVVVLGLIGAQVLALPNMVLFSHGSVPWLIWNFVSQWVTVMVGVSILTTLYGHYVEGRPLV